MPRYYKASEAISRPWASIVFHCPVPANPRVLCAQLTPVSVGFSDDDTASSGDDLLVWEQSWQRATIALAVICGLLIALLVLSLFCCYFKGPGSEASTKLNNAPTSSTTSLELTTA